MNTVELELREQFTDTFERATYPVASPFELIPILPDGPATEFSAGTMVIPAIELGTKHGNHLKFPYHSVEEFVDDLIIALYEDDILNEPRPVDHREESR